MPFNDALVQLMFNQKASAEYQLYQRINNELMAHTNTLDMLRRVKNGDVPLERLIVTDDGFQVMPERPAPSEPTDG